MAEEMTAAEEVAEDYKRELEELSGINRAEISTLTMIARESTEHAMAISEVLFQHILKVAPSKKLPALYVLDSIVKNVGTPYTLYTARNLYKLFMESYAVVDHGVRRKMEEMLNTWKGPVPGSIDTRPVFPPEIVGSIENALFSSRASAAQRLGAARPSPHVMGRDTLTPTSTPPHMRPGSAIPQQQQYASPYPQPQQQHQAHLPHQQQPHAAYRGATTGGGAGPPSSGAAGPGSGSSGLSIDSLNSDIENLMVALQARRNIDASPQIGIQLAALGQLKELVQRRDLSPEQLAQVRNQVAQFAVNVPTHSRHSVPPPPPSHSQHHVPQYYGHGGQPPPSSMPPLPMPLPAAAAAAAPVVPSAAAPPPPTSIDALLGKGALAALLAAKATPPALTPFPAPASAPAPTPTPTSVVPPPTAAPLSTAPRDPLALLAELRRAGLVAPTPTPPPASAPPAPVPAHHPPPPAAAVSAVATPPLPTASAPPVQNPLGLLEQLRRAGMLPSAPATTSGVPAVGTPPPPPVDLARILGMAGAVPVPAVAAAAAATPRGPVDELTHVPLTSSMLKHQFRPHLLSNLYESLGPACNLCGRRFRTDDEGRRRKTAHMDWHFHVRQRLIEAEKRGQHRSWNVDVHDWVKSREIVDALPSSDDPSSSFSFSTDPSSSYPSYSYSTDSPSSTPTMHPSDLPNHHHPSSSSSFSFSHRPNHHHNSGGTNPSNARYIAVPDPASRTNRTCPVCQEKFKNEFHAATQEWVWMDVVLVNGRAYHSDCRPRKRGADEITA